MKFLSKNNKYVLMFITFGASFSVNMVKIFFENASSPGTENRRHSLILLFGLFFPTNIFLQQERNIFIRETNPSLGV